MAKRTDKYKLRVPEPSDPVNVVADIGENMEKLDRILAVKQDSLTEEQIEAVNSKITAEKVVVYDEHMKSADKCTNPHVTDDERKKWNNATSTPVATAGDGIEIKVENASKAIISQKKVLEESGSVGAGDNRFIAMDYDSMGNITKIAEKDMVTIKEFDECKEKEGYPLDASVGYKLHEVDNELIDAIRELGGGTKTLVDRFYLQKSVEAYDISFKINDLHYSIEDFEDRQFVMLHNGVPGKEEKVAEITYNEEKTEGWFNLGNAEGKYKIKYHTDYVGDKRPEVPNMIWCNGENPTVIDVYAQQLGFLKEEEKAAISIMVSTNRHIWRYNIDSKKWVDIGSKTGEMFTDHSPGLIQGHVGDGYVQSTPEGYGRVSGWEDFHEELEKERRERAAGDLDLEKQIDNEVEVRLEEDKRILEDLNGEKQARIEADENLARNIEAETEDRKTGEQALADKIGEESSTREEADKTLQDNINAEAEERKKEDKTLNEALKEETRDRKSGDAELYGEIQQEAKEREEADEKLTEQIVDEKSAREEADKALGEEIAKRVVRETAIGNGKSLVSNNASDQGACLKYEGTDKTLSAVSVHDGSKTGSGTGIYAQMYAVDDNKGKILSLTKDGLYLYPKGEVINDSYKVVVISDIADIEEIKTLMTKVEALEAEVSSLKWSGENKK